MRWLPVPKCSASSYETLTPSEDETGYQGAARDTDNGCMDKLNSLLHIEFTLHCFPPQAHDYISKGSSAFCSDHSAQAMKQAVSQGPGAAQGPGWGLPSHTQPTGSCHPSHQVNKPTATAQKPSSETTSPPPKFQNKIIVIQSIRTSG